MVSCVKSGLLSNIASRTPSLNPVAHLKYFHKVGGYHYDRGPLIDQVIHNIVYFVTRPYINSPCGFVKYIYIRIGIQPLCNNHLLLVSPRQTGYRQGQPSHFNGKL